MPGVVLFAVGDDWQSINRFAGADLSVMTRFDDWFGTATTLRLQRTFRSPQSICDVSSAFIGKNPGQLSKLVVSDQPEYPPAVTAVAVRSNTEYAAVINRYLTALDRALGAGTIATGRDGRTSVYLLGRYRKVREAVQPVLDREWVNLDVRFNTMHGAKGKEADFVVLVGMVRRGMPSTIEDDPLLQLAMPAGDSFTDAEDRRLFCVALTRTRRSVLLLTVERQESPFLLELIQDGHLTLESAAGESSSARSAESDGKSGRTGGTASSTAAAPTPNATGSCIPARDANSLDLRCRAPSRDIDVRLRWDDRDPGPGS